MYELTVVFYLCAVCDPVLGDDGEMYVPESLIPIYQNKILPLADICTPNQFEAERLTGKSIKTEEDAWRAIEWFHEKGIKIVVLSSTTVGSDSELIGFLSQKNGMALSIPGFQCINICFYKNIFSYFKV